jgi:hypothetical protein
MSASFGQQIVPMSGLTRTCRKYSRSRNGSKNAGKGYMLREVHDAFLPIVKTHAQAIVFQRLNCHHVPKHNQSSCAIFFNGAWRCPNSPIFGKLRLVWQSPIKAESI